MTAASWMMKWWENAIQHPTRAEHSIAFFEAEFQIRNMLENVVGANDIKRFVRKRQTFSFRQYKLDVVLAFQSREIIAFIEHLL